MSPQICSTPERAEDVCLRSRTMSSRSICEMNLEAELFTLQDSNSKLVAALHEANNNVEQWKKQLVAYQEETERLRDQVSVVT